MAERPYGVEEVGQRFGVSRQSALGWITRGLKGVRLEAHTERYQGGDRYLVSEEAIRKFSIATGRIPRDLPQQESQDKIQFEIELAFERSARRDAEARVLVLEERLTMREDEVERLTRTVTALKEAVVRSNSNMSDVITAL